MNAIMDGLEPIVDSLRMKELLGDLSDKRGKIARMIHSGNLFPLRRGLYTTRRDLNPFCLAAPIYGPSYISFETALSLYGLIPEAVYEITSATLRRPKEFETCLDDSAITPSRKWFIPLALSREQNPAFRF